MPISLGVLDQNTESHALAAGVIVSDHEQHGLPKGGRESPGLPDQLPQGHTNILRHNFLRDIDQAFDILIVVSEVILDIQMSLGFSQSQAFGRWCSGQSHVIASI